MAKINDDQEWDKNAQSIMQSYLPTPPLGRDTTQGQFLSGV